MGQCGTQESCPHGVFRRVARQCQHSVLRAGTGESVVCRSTEARLGVVKEGFLEEEVSNVRPLGCEGVGK